MRPTTKPFFISLAICIAIAAIAEIFFPKGNPWVAVIAFGFFWAGSWWTEDSAEKNMSPLVPRMLMPTKELPQFVQIGDCYEVLYSVNPDGDRTFINVLRDVSPDGDPSKIFVVETNNGYGLPRRFQIRVQRFDEHSYPIVFTPLT